MASSGVKDFYRQKKKGGVTKASPSSKKKTQQYTGGASVGASDTAQTSALVFHGSWDLKGTPTGTEDQGGHPLEVSEFECADYEPNQGFPQPDSCDCCGKYVCQSEEPQEWTVEWVPASPTQE